ncbi:MAG: hypothetical protein ABSB38_03565 [Dehalococcoidia bacterium]|jgi:hypothetical protein
MDKTYTESELRDKLSRKTERITEGLIGRLRDDGLLNDRHFRVQSKIEPNGSITIDGEPIRQSVQEFVHVLLVEFLKELLVALFEEDGNSDIPFHN